jgi:hypothetical protein
LNIDPALLNTHTQAGLLPDIISNKQDPIPPPGFQQIDWFHLALPFMFHVLCCCIALLVFMAQTGIAVCKYGYNTVLSSYCYCSGVMRMAASRTGQGIETEYSEDMEDQLTTVQEMKGPEEEVAAGATDHEDIVVLNIE